MLGLYELISKFKPRLVLSKVVDNKDPKKLCRVRLTNELYEGVPKDKLPWASQLTSSFSSSNSNTNFYVPNEGDIVLAIYLTDIYHPLYFSFHHQGNTKTLATYPDAYGFVDSKGNEFYIDRKTGELKFKHFTGTTLTIKQDGSVKVNIVKRLNIHSVDEITIKSDKHILMQAPKIDLNP